MKSRKKRISGILLILAMMLGMMLAMSATSYAAESPEISVLPQDGGAVTVTEDDGYWVMTPVPNEGFAFDHWSFIEFGHPEGTVYNPWRAPQRDIANLDNITAHFREIVNYDLWVGGTQVTSENAGNVLEDGKVSFTPAKDDTPATLTLKGATITTGHTVNSHTYGIYYSGATPLNINLQSGSENSISGVDRCIFNSEYDASLTISGGGTLNASSTSYYGIGIFARDALTINDGTINVAMTGDEASAIQAESNNGVITIDGGTVNVSANGANGYGILSFSAEVVVIQNGSNVTASGKKKAIGGTVKNAIAGTGWKDTQGTGDGVRITKSGEDGQILDYLKVQFPFDHEHNFAYNVSGATITATCTEEGCPYNNTPATLTMLKPTLEKVGGQGDPEVTLSGKIPGVTPTVKYKQGDTDLESAPTVAGNYTASVTVSGATASVNYTIEEEYPLWVGGTRLKYTNKGDVLSDDSVNKGKVSYEPVGNTLTLNGANIADGYAEVGGEKYGIYYTGSKPLNIILSSDNTTIGGASIHEGIKSDAEVSISGNGKLTINEVVNGIDAQGISIKGGEITATADGSAILGKENCTITGGTVEASGRYGIATDHVIIGENASVTATGTEIAITGNVKNAIDGTGWTNVGGTEGVAIISVNDTGQDLSNFKKVQFPTVFKYPLWIGKVQVTGENQNDVLGDDTVSFTPSEDGKSGTLTLNGANISGENGNYTQDEVYYDNYGTIRTKLSNLTIKVESDSTVNGPGEGIYEYGIYARGCDLTITGEGTLTAAVSSNRSSFGVCADNIVIDGKLSASGKTTDSWAISCGVNAKSSVTINKSAELTATGTGSKGVAIYSDSDTAKLQNAIAGTGWTDVEGTGEGTVITTGTHSKESLKQYKKVQFPGTVSYTVTFVDGQGKTLKTETVEKGKAATAPAAPTREGYTFNGWDTDFSNVTSDLIVTAKWKQIQTTYQVKFEDGLGKVLDTQTVVEGRPATAPADPVREGYLFSGWDTDFSNVSSDLTVKAMWTEEPQEEGTYKVVFVFGFGNDPVVREVGKGESAAAPDIPTVEGFTFDGWDKEFTNITENLTVTAQWKRNTAGNVHTVVFVDGYSVNPLLIQRVKDGQSANPPEDPTREGYIFEGWDSDFSYVTENMTVIAQWKQNAPAPAETFTVTFVDGLGKTLDTQTVEKGKAAAAPEDPTRDGYTFNGWDTDFSNVTSDLIVTAKWKQIQTTYQVKFEDGLGKVLDTQTVVEGRPATAPADPVREGYLFSGWDTDFSNVSSDLTVKAVWTEEPQEEGTYKVVFVFGFGNDPVVREVGKGESAAAPDIPTVEGFTFDGWDKEFTNITENLTVTAQWKRNTAGNVHTVVFVDGYSVNPILIQRVKDGQSANPPEDPTREGYTFEGWDTDFSYVTENMTVIAQWKQNAPAPAETFTVTFVDGLGKTLDTQTVEKGKAAAAPEEPTRDGYTFDGWDKDFSSVTSDLTVTAKWKESAEPTPTPTPTPAPTPAPTPTKVSGMLLAKTTAKGKNSITISWNAVNGAKGYDIYFDRCNGKDGTKGMKKVKTIKAGKTLKWTRTGLKKKTAYKAYVKAYTVKNGKKKYIKTSPLSHAYTSGASKKYSNAKALTVNKKKVTLKKGKTFKIKTKIAKVKKNKKLMPKTHVKTVRYMTSNKKVAAVSASGKITAKGKGTCTVIVFTHNCVSKKIKVTVK